MKTLTHQFGMFGFTPDKIRIMDKAEKIKFTKVLKNGRAKMKKGDFRGAAEDVARLGDFLESFERRLNGIRDKENSKPEKKLKPGDLVMVELDYHGKTEIVDATVIGITSKGVHIKTYWGQEFPDINRRLVRRR
jgi:hypothetical protein